MNNISSLFEPSVDLIELKVADYSYRKDAPDASETSPKDIEFRGVEYPHIQTEEYIFGAEEILNMTIDSTGILPKISLKVKLETSGIFFTTNFPKDGDLLSVYIRGRDDLFKPIRNDYLITNIDTVAGSQASPEGKGAILFFEGELYIPHLYDNINQAYKGTSFSVMEELAKELHLGFATNEDSTNDEMTWITFNNRYELMKHISGAAWKDESSFFTFFIDVYYHLNFINVNTLIDYNADVLEALTEDPFTNAGIGDDTVSKGMTEKCINNHPERNNDNFYIKRFKPINRSSEISKKYGYALNIKFFDHESLELWELQAKSLITEGAENDKILLRGRPGDDSYNDQQIDKYIGIQHNKPDHNVHENFYFARAHNLMNNKELEKLNIEAVLNKFNFNLYRYENIPAVFFVTGDIRRIKELNVRMDDEGKNEDGLSIAIDNFYTGFYLIKGLKIQFKPSIAGQAPRESSFTESLILTRREWPEPI